MKLNPKFAVAIFFAAMALAPLRANIDLLQRYPTHLTEGDLNGANARSWEFTDSDIFALTQFNFATGGLRIEMGPSDVGFGHGSDGALWAAIIPRADSALTSSASAQPETIAHIWLRFHPKEIDTLFPPATVSGQGAAKLLGQIRFIAGAKMRSSCQAGGKPMVPEPKTILVDLDTKTHARRFYVVDSSAKTARYDGFLEKWALRPPPAFTPELAGEAFDKLWNAFDRHYAMFVLRPEVDWAKLREQYRPKALASQSPYEFADACAGMLKNLRDLHVWLTLGGQYVPVYNRPRTKNANRGADFEILGNLHDERTICWAVTADHIGYLAIESLDDEKIPGLCGEALEHMRNTRGIILDLRLNGGGSEPLAEPIAGRFLEKPYVYASSQFRNGPAHTNLTAHDERVISPRGPWRYDRPVLVLIGQKCMSSAESFVGMMTGDPLAQTMGDHTCGSSGNPEIIQLPLDMTVSVPRWIDYRPDGVPLDEKGFEPQIPFHPSPGAFEGHNDELLTAALARLGKLPLPDQPIPGPAFERELSDLPDHSAAVKQEAADPSRPRVISVEPSDGATNVAPLTSLRLRFDRAMDPLSLKLNWDAGGYMDCNFPQYDAEKHEFTIPLQLLSASIQQIVVNAGWGGDKDLAQERKHRSRDGFQSADHHLAGLFSWRFHTRAAGSNETLATGLSTAEAQPQEASPRDATLLEKLEQMQQRRSQLLSVSERVQYLTQTGKEGVFNDLNSVSAVFKWQKPGQYYADITEPMLSCADFRIGSDGGACWWHAVGSDGKWAKFESCPVSDVQYVNVTICDPFDLVNLRASTAASRRNLVYAGTTRFGESECFLILAPETRWWIDANSFLPIQVRTRDKDYTVRSRFFYDKVNESLPAQEFGAPILSNESPARPAPLEKRYTGRFIQISDGSDGSVSGRWGMQGPGCRSSSGLN